MSDPLTNFDDVMQRLAQATGAEHDAALARLLGMSTSDFAQRKKRKKVPLDRLVSVASLRNISVDWLLTGGGERHLQHGSEAQEVKYRPPGLQVGEQRIEKLLALLAQLDPEEQDAIFTECHTRASNAQRLTDLRQAVQELEAKLGT